MVRFARAVAAVAFAVSSLGVLTISPASAGSFCNGSNATNAPDGRIKLDKDPYVGAGSYPQTGIFGELTQGEQANYKFRWQNMGGDNLTIRVNLHDARKGPGFAVQWFLGDMKVNSVLKGGDALVFHNLAPGASTPAIKLVVKNKSATDGEVVQELRGRYKGSQPNRCDLLIADVDFGIPT